MIADPPRRAAPIAALALAGVVALFAAASQAWADGDAAAKDLSVSERMEIFRALEGAEERAERAAAKQLADEPGSLSEEELAAKLTKEYRAKVMRDHGITKERAEEIVEEGYAKQWPVDEGPVETGVD